MFIFQSSLFTIIPLHSWVHSAACCSTLVWSIKHVTVVGLNNLSLCSNLHTIHPCLCSHYITDVLILPCSIIPVFNRKSIDWEQRTFHTMVTGNRCWKGSDANRVRWTRYVVECSVGGGGLVVVRGGGGGGGMWWGGGGGGEGGWWWWGDKQIMTMFSAQFEQQYTKFKSTIITFLTEAAAY